MSAITTAVDAEQTIDAVTALLEKLSELMQQETTLVHAGRVKQASDLGATKSKLAGELFGCSERLKANAKFLLQSVPARCATLQRRQEAFRAVLHRNMIVLATTHAVSESIVRRLSGEMTRKASPQVYGATGRTTAPNPKQSRPLAISRSL
jgi:flagellar biosynthesis/type III secretory pathway chaperone